MRSVFSERAVSASLKLTAATAMALALAACSTDTTRFSQPMFSSSNDYTGSITPKQGVGYGGVNPERGGASQPVIQQAPLAAPGSYPSQPYPSQPYPQGQASYTPPQQSYPQQGGYTPPSYDGSYNDGSPGSVSSIGTTAKPGTHVTVEQGETLYSISRRYGVPVNALMQANGISDPTQVRVGQRLTVPTYSASRSGWVTGPQPAGATPAPQPVAMTPAPKPRQTSNVATATKVDRQPPAAAAPTSSGGTHTVATGETLYSISRRYGVTVEALSAQNGISSPSQLRVGQRLSIPGAGSTAAVISTKPQQVAVRTQSPEPVQQYAAQPEPEPQVVADDKPINTASIPAPQAINEGFRWPARGRVISAFGEANQGSTNEGINIAVPEGTSVRAAENGVVIYAGSELEGLGNLVLVRHADNWVTAYAHNRDVRVNRGDKVSRGQIIATAGQTGKVTSPQLHFELRKGSKPVDPLRYLSAL
ncbi:MAG: LysM peptidoglycan-binding domain-containing protein [Rhodobiaceae bacterium]|nr:LysM peptidoglycan-binding domain-containing protein [Rhodobiaceae bacterium]